MWEMLSALVSVLGAILVLGVLVRSLGLPGMAARRRLRIVESASLGGRNRLHVVEVDGQALLLSASDKGIELVDRLGSAEAPAREAGADRDAVEGVAQAGWRRWARALVRVSPIGLALVCLDPGLAWAQEAGAARIALDVQGLGEPEQISNTLQIVGILTLISIAPAFMLMATCFTRILIVMTLLRQALGVHQVPPNQVMAALALFTTLFVMAPVGERVYDEALEPYMARQLEAPDAARIAMVPIREYLLHHTREKDLALFVELSRSEPPETPEEVSIATLLPAFMISELRTAFEIGFMIYLPFLIIDIVIASMLISLGMIVLPPMMIALPFKLMLFVLLDGWNLVLGSLVAGLQ